MARSPLSASAAEMRAARLAGGQAARVMSRSPIEEGWRRPAQGAIPGAELLQLNNGELRRQRLRGALPGEESTDGCHFRSPIASPSVETTANAKPGRRRSWRIATERSFQRASTLHHLLAGSVDAHAVAVIDRTTTMSESRLSSGRQSSGFGVAPRVRYLRGSFSATVGARNCTSLDRAAACASSFPMPLFLGRSRCAWSRNCRSFRVFDASRGT